MSKVIITTKFLRIEAEVSEQTAQAIASTLVDALLEDEKNENAAETDAKATKQVEP